MARSSIRQHLKLKPSKLAQKRRQALILRFTIYLVFFLSLIVGVSFLSAADFITVNEVKISGLESLEEKQIQKIIEEKTNGRLFWLFAKNNFLIYPKDAIKKELLSQHKRLAEAKVSIKDFSFLEVVLRERHPFGIWCGVSDDCFYLDQTGFIFNEAERFATSPAMITYYGKVPGKKIGEYYLEPESFNELHKFIKLLSSTLKADTLNVRKDGQSIEIALESGTLITIPLEDDLDKIFENIITLLNDSEFESEGKTIKDFSSIDLRFGQKVFYKLK